MTVSLSILKKQAAQLAVKRMLAKNCVDICDVRFIADALGRQCERSASYPVLRLLHLVQFSKMSPELREAIPGMLADTLGIGEESPVAEVQPTMAEGPQAVVGACVEALPSSELA